MCEAPIGCGPDQVAVAGGFRNERTMVGDPSAVVPALSTEERAELLPTIQGIVTAYPGIVEIWASRSSDMENPVCAEWSILAIYDDGPSGTSERFVSRCLAEVTRAARDRGMTVNIAPTSANGAELAMARMAVAGFQIYAGWNR